MTADREIVVGVVGGASGVGKTTLLDAVPWTRRVNTGDLFKKHMTLGDRDAIRAGDWSQVEGCVAEELKTFVSDSISIGNIPVIDTHFAAKLRGVHYRIGLKRNLIHTLATGIFRNAMELSVLPRFEIVHIDSDPYSLLDRRRKDLSRKRELVPSDCVKALSRNSVCAGQYLQEVVRASNDCRVSAQLTALRRIENDDLATSKQQMVAIFAKGDRDVRVHLDN